MSEHTSFELPNGLTVTSDPKKHSTPDICEDCGVLYYFAGHFCTERETSKAFKRALQGYYDGE